MASQPQSQPAIRDDLPMLLKIPEVAERLRLSRAQVGRLIAREHLPVIRFGKAVRISPIALQRWLEHRSSTWPP
jgi:excisionase family DNA binding protein